MQEEWSTYQEQTRLLSVVRTPLYLSQAQEHTHEIGIAGPILGCNAPQSSVIEPLNREVPDPRRTCSGCESQSTLLVDVVVMIPDHRFRVRNLNMSRNAEDGANWYMDQAFGVEKRSGYTIKSQSGPRRQSVCDIPDNL
jgi:hypothetical protein